MAGAQFNVHEAKTQLSRILALVEQGETVTISRAGEPVAQVVPFRKRAGRTFRGTLAGAVSFSDDWDSSEVNDAIAEDFQR